jgi:hypothetical protein
LEGTDVRISSRATHRGLTILTAGAVLTTGLLVAAGPAQAHPGQAGRIYGGVEDGTFSRTCLKGGAVDPGVLQGTGATYRAALAGGSGTVRVLVPWNIATAKADAADLACLTSYMAAAHGNAKVEVSLSRSSSHGSDPSPAAYTKSVRALARLKLGFSYVTAYNEPNNHSYLTDKHPATQAGRYFVIAHKIFGNKVVAGDFASGVSGSFLTNYLKAMGKLRPRIWAIHPYTDITNFQFYLSDQPANHKNPVAAARRANKTSKVGQFARLLAKHKFGKSTRIWLNEIYIDHRADKCPPGSHAGSGANKNKCVTGGKPITQPGKGKVFSLANQADAALYLSGALGRYSLPGMLRGHNVPQLTQYIYLRALDDATNIQFKDADVLQVHFKSCVYYTLAGSKRTPAPQCKS